MSRLFFDTEFIEDGVTIDLVSIGVVRDDGATYYAEPRESDLTKSSDWVRANVLPHLDRCPRAGEDAIRALMRATKPRAQIAAELIDFAGPNPEWWAYFADYDWVALCQLYGRMIDLPTGWPMYCRDVKQLADEHGVDLKAVPQENEHHALADACWTKAAWGAVRAVGGVPMTSDGPAAAVLSCPMNDPNDADAATIRDYLIQLLLKVWIEQDEFSGKRPFGNSGWTGEIEMALIAAGLVDGRVDEDGYIAEVDDAAVDRLIILAIAVLGATT